MRAFIEVSAHVARRLDGHRPREFHAHPRFRAAVVLAALLSIAGAPTQARSQPADSSFWVTNGPVHAAVLAGDRLYIGGAFTHVGPLTGGGVPVDLASARAAPRFPKVWGTLYAIVADGAGGCFVGGAFDSVSGLARRNLAHVRADLTLSDWDPGADGPVWSLATNGAGTIWAAGDFTTIGGQPRRGVAALDASGAATAWDVASDGPVWAVLLRGDDLFLGGAFTSIGGQPRSLLAKADASTGAVADWSPNPIGADSVVYVLASPATPGRVYVGGRFAGVGGATRHNIAELDAETGVATAWNPDASGAIETILAAGDRVFVGGGFGWDPRMPPDVTIGGEPRRGIAALDTITGHATPWNPDASGAVLDMALIGDHLYVCGEFRLIGGEDRSYAAALDTTDGRATAWDPSADGHVWAIEAVTSGVYVGGAFTSVGGRWRNRIAALDVLTGAGTDWNPGASGTVRTIAVDGSTVYVGGDFNAGPGPDPSIGGERRDFIAALDATTGHATAWDPHADRPVYALAAEGGVVYTGGMFTMVGGAARRGLAALDGATGFATLWSPDPNGPVYALATDAGTIYAGGAFTTIGGQGRSRIASLDPSTGFPNPWNPGALGTVTALRMGSGVIYAGGNFGQVDGQVRRGLAAIDLVYGHATGWNPNADRGPITSIATLGENVYAGGSFGQIGGVTRPFVAAVDADSGRATSWNPTPNNVVRALAAGAGTVYMGGDFTRVLGARRPYLAAIPTDVASGPAPLIVMDYSAATGPIVGTPGAPPEIVITAITDSLDPADPTRAPRDTVPSEARIDFRFHSVPVLPGSFAVAYRYRMDEPDWVTVSAVVSSVSYNTGVAGDRLSPGTKLFRLRVIDNEGREREITRRFQLNHDPDTWFAGPDLAVLDPLYGWTGPLRSLAIGDWRTLPPLPGSLLSCDSLTRRPRVRTPNKTFFEIYGDRLYVRTEGDTVHMNSWVVVHGGGGDVDSPYLVDVSPAAEIPDTAACASAGIPWTVRPAGLTGSPIGFRQFHSVRLDPFAMLFTPAATSLFPVFDPVSVWHRPMVAAYTRMAQTGKAYYVLASQDGDGARDVDLRDAASAMLVADRVDAGQGTPRDIELRRKILTFHVNQAPRLLLGHPAFVPQPETMFPERTLRLNLLADDSDPYVPGDAAPPGGPTPMSVLRLGLTLRGMDREGHAVSYPVPASPFFSPQVTVDVPSLMAGPDVTIDVELCDCAACEVEPGSGRCVTYSIPVHVPSEVTETAASLVSATASMEGVRVSWQAPRGARARVERRTDEADWRVLVEEVVGTSGVLAYEDREVEPGVRYAFRLGVWNGDTWRSGEQVWVEVPRAEELALTGVHPNPSNGGEVTVRFALPSAEPAVLVVLDVTGRVVARREVGSLGAGRHAIALSGPDRMTPGVYLARLLQGREVRTARMIVIE